VSCLKKNKKGVLVRSKRSAFLKDGTFKFWNPHNDTTGVLDVENAAKMCTGNAVEAHQKKLNAQKKPVGWDIAKDKKGNVMLSRGTNWK
jgi:hypothetical protein